jgi:hypothetical protein
LLFHPDNLFVKMSFVSFRKSRSSKLRQRQRRMKGKKPGSKRCENPGKPWKRKTWKKPAKPHQKWTAKQKPTPFSYEMEFAFHNENYPEDPDEMEFERMTINGESRLCVI